MIKRKISAHTLFSTVHIMGQRKEKYLEPNSEVPPWFSALIQISSFSRSSQTFHANVRNVFFSF